MVSKDWAHQKSGASKIGLAKIGLAKIGLAKIGLAKISNQLENLVGKPCRHPHASE
jgi:hypothetical protein